MSQQFLCPRAANRETHTSLSPRRTCLTFRSLLHMHVTHAYGTKWPTLLLSTWETAPDLSAERPLFPTDRNHFSQTKLPGTMSPLFTSISLAITGPSLVQPLLTGSLASPLC